jgi:hypothetical protein
VLLNRSSPLDACIVVCIENGDRAGTIIFDHVCLAGQAAVPVMTLVNARSKNVHIDGEAIFVENKVVGIGTSRKT